MFLVGEEDTPEAFLKYAEGHSEIFCNWPMFDKEKKLVNNQIIIKRNDEGETDSNSHDKLPFMNGTAHIICRKKFFNAANPKNLKQEYNIYKIVDTGNDKYVGIAFETSQKLEIVTKADEKIYITSQKTKIPNIVIIGLREIFLNIFKPKNTYFDSIAKIFKYSNVLYTYTKENNKIYERDEV